VWLSLSKIGTQSYANVQASIRDSFNSASVYLRILQPSQSLTRISHLLQESLGNLVAKINHKEKEIKEKNEDTEFRVKYI